MNATVAKRNIKPIPSLARQLKLARANKGYSQTHAARKLGINPRAISQWETAKTAPSARKLQQVAELYGVTLDWLWNAADDRAGAPLKTVPIIHTVLDGPVKSLRDIAVLEDLPMLDRIFQKVGVKGENIVMLYSHRDAMSPTVGLRDILFIDVSVTEVKATRGVYAVTDGLALMIRRVERMWSDKGKAIYRLTGDNPAVEKRDVPLTKLRALGEVVAVLHFLR
jgi:transcriptional regulator with XRE-family HTH domain